MAVRGKPRMSRLSPMDRLISKERRKETLRAYAQSRHVVRLTETTWMEWNRIKVQENVNTHDELAALLLRAWATRQQGTESDSHDLGENSESMTDDEVTYSTLEDKEVTGPSSFPVSDISESNEEISYKIIKKEKQEESFYPGSQCTLQEDDFKVNTHEPAIDDSVPCVQAADTSLKPKGEDAIDEEPNSDDDYDSGITPRNLVTEKKSICYEENLLKLARINITTSCHVKGCEGIVGPKTEYNGSAVRIEWICSNGHTAKKWDSQPLVRGMRAGDVLLSSAILVTGCSYEKIKLLFSFLGLGLTPKSSHLEILTNHCSSGITTSSQT